MRRREVIGGLVAAAIILPAAPRAQQRLARIGFLVTAPVDSPEFKWTIEPFRQGMLDLGYVEGRSYVIEYRSADGDQSRFHSLATDLVRSNVDIVWAAGTPHARAAQAATATIPIVVAAMSDPVADGLVASLARPGGNVTGLTTLGAELNPKRLDLLKQAIPSLSRVAHLWHPGGFGNRTASEILQATLSAAGKLRVQLGLIEVEGAEGIDEAIDKIAREGYGAALVAHSSMFNTERRRIVERLTTHRMAAMFPTRPYVDLGGLMSYGTDVPDLFRRSAGYVDKILKGAKPSDLPVEQPTRFELVINLKTAKALGLTIPPTLLVFADEVIE